MPAVKMAPVSSAEQTRRRLESCKADVAAELAELQLEHQLKLSDKTREHVDRNYWTTLTELLKRGNHLSLPAGYELDNVNWIHTFFDYLTTDPAHSGGHAFELEYLIPDTIIIKQRRAYAWLTANKSPIVRKDKITELQPKYIFEGLCAAYRRKAGTLQPHNVLAYLLVTKLPTANNPKPVPSIEYFNAAMLQTYLFERLRTDDCTGILQLFIPPPGTRNAVIRAWWTPYSLRIEQRANKNDLESAHTPISDRSSTFDGHMHNSEIRNMHGEDLRDEVAEQLEWIIDHLSALLPYTHQIWSGVFYFKMGFDGRLYLLWCSSLQFEQAKHSGAPPPRPMTPKCKHSDEQRHEPDEEAAADKGAGRASQKGGVARLGLTGSSKNEMCPSCGRSAGDPLSHCPEIGYKVRYLSLVRRLQPSLYEAVRAEAHIALICASTPEQWAEYLFRAGAARYTYYGEDMDTKFPRPSPQVAFKSLSNGGNASRPLQARPNSAEIARVGSAGGGAGEGEARGGGGKGGGGGGRHTSAAGEAEAEAEDRRQLRQIVQAYCPNTTSNSSNNTNSTKGAPAPLSANKLREFVLHCACHPSFADRLIMVCQDCCLIINQAEMTQSKKDLDECAAPLDYIQRAPALVSAARPHDDRDSLSTTSSLLSAPSVCDLSQDLSHLVTRLKTNAERFHEMHLARQESLAQTEDFKRRSQHVLNGNDDKVLSAPDARKVADAMQELREALRPEWERKGLALHAKPKKLSVIRRTPSRSKTIKSLMKDGDPHMASLRNIMGGLDTPPPEAVSGRASVVSHTGSGASALPGQTPMTTYSGAPSRTGSWLSEAEDRGEGHDDRQAQQEDSSGAQATPGTEGWAPVASRVLKPNLSERVAAPADAGINIASSPVPLGAQSPSSGARGTFARKSQAERNRAAFQRWKNHFDVSNELDALSFSHIETTDIQEEMSETQANLARLALRIEKECDDQRFVREQIEAADTGWQGSNEALAATGARPDSVGKSVPSLSMNRIRAQNRSKVLQRFMSPRLRSRAMRLYELEQEAQLQEEEERRAALNQVRWSSTAYLIQLRLRNEALASLRYTAIDYSQGAYDEAGSDHEDTSAKPARRFRRPSSGIRQEQRQDRLRHAHEMLERRSSAGAASALVLTGEEDGLAARLEAERDSRPSFNPSRPPIGAAATAVAAPHDRQGGAGNRTGSDSSADEEGALGSGAGAAMATATGDKGKGEGASRRAAADDDVNSGPASGALQQDQGHTSVGAHAADRHRARIYFAEDNGEEEGSTEGAGRFGLSSFKRARTSNKRIKNGKATAEVEQERAAWKLRIKEREAAREAERARKHQQKQFEAPPLPPLKGEAYIKTSEDIKKRYLLTERRSNPGGGGLLLPGGALLLPLKHRHQHQPPRAATSLGLHRSHAGDEDGARESDASANTDTRARALTRTQPPRPTSSLDDAVTHGSSARHPVTKLSAYKTTFIEAYDPTRSIGTVYIAGRPRTSKAFGVDAAPAWQSGTHITAHTATSVAPSHLAEGKAVGAGAGAAGSQPLQKEKGGRGKALPALSLNGGNGCVTQPLKEQHQPSTRDPESDPPLAVEEVPQVVDDEGGEQGLRGDAGHVQDDSAPHQDASVVVEEDV